MTATITLAHRHANPFTVTDEDTVRAIAEAVAAYNRGDGDARFRVRRTANLAVRFHASDVAALNANGIDLVDPFEMTGAVAA